LFQTTLRRGTLSVYVKPLLECVTEYVVRTYPTPDSGLTYLDYPQIAWTTPSFALSRMTASVSLEDSTSAS